MSDYDIAQGNRSGVSVRAYPDGLMVDGWYDTYVGLEPLFIPWEKLEELRKKARRRTPYGERR